MHKFGELACRYAMRRREENIYYKKSGVRQAQTSSFLPFGIRSSDLLGFWLRVITSHSVLPMHISMMWCVLIWSNERNGTERSWELQWEGSQEVSTTIGPALKYNLFRLDRVGMEKADCPVDGHKCHRQYGVVHKSEPLCLNILVFSSNKFISHLWHRSRRLFFFSLMLSTLKQASKHVKMLKKKLAVEEFLQSLQLNLLVHSN